MRAYLSSVTDPRARFSARAARAKSVATGLLLLAPLAGCGTTDRMKTSSIPLDDYRTRHPILLAQDTTTIDIFPSESFGTLDSHTAKQIIAFAQEYRQAGHGPVLVLLPRGRGHGEPRHLLAGIKRALALGGANVLLDVSFYPIVNPELASPVRLSFNGLKAKVADQCGQWPNDLASGSSVDGWSNRTYYNFGCATQSMIAAQTADPRDLVTPRGEEPPDTLIRSRAIDNVRKGTDPATSWSTHNSSIGTVGGGS